MGDVRPLGGDNENGHAAVEAVREALKGVTKESLETEAAGLRARIGALVEKMAHSDVSYRKWETQLLLTGIDELGRIKREIARFG